MPYKKRKDTKFSSENQRTIFKLNLVGDSNVGKSTLVKLISEGSFVPEIGISIGMNISYWNTKYKGRDIKAQLWDLMNTNNLVLKTIQDS
ncbi:MAG: hypothetical protein EU547_02330 [Promethearchaeota archaeon]|nr:MAG: hypothetical protein EU547_02330 [Candidatus Lokiarchaeota archaeon]